jgi:hypothetical protein
MTIKLPCMAKLVRPSTMVRLMSSLYHKGRDRTSDAIRGAIFRFSLISDNFDAGLSFPNN